MAEGRMLKRKIATSQRLAELKTNDARLLWTWFIPFLDIEGRYHASPEIIKGTIFPRISSFTTRKIKKCLEDLVRVKLISIYTVNDDQFLEVYNFKDNQTLRLDREKPSSIPAQPQLQEQVQDNSRSTPAKDKLKEGKLKEGKTVPLKNGTVKVSEETHPPLASDKPNSVGESGTGAENNSEINARWVRDYLNEVTGENFTDISQIKNRLDEGIPPETLIQWIDTLWKEAGDSQNPSYFNSDTIFHTGWIEPFLRERGNDGQRQS